MFGYFRHVDNTIGREVNDESDYLLKSSLLMDGINYSSRLPSPTGACLFSGRRWHSDNRWRGGGACPRASE